MNWMIEWLIFSNLFWQLGSLTFDEFNKLADQTNDFAVDERGEAVGEDGIMSAHPPAYVRNRLKDEKSQEILSQMNNSQLLGMNVK